MNRAQCGAIGSFIWNIADDVLRDVYVRGKYRNVILPTSEHWEVHRAFDAEQTSSFIFHPRDWRWE